MSPLSFLKGIDENFTPLASTKYKLVIKHLPLWKTNKSFLRISSPCNNQNFVGEIETAIVP